MTFEDNAVLNESLFLNCLNCFGDFQYQLSDPEWDCSDITETCCQTPMETLLNNTLMTSNNTLDPDTVDEFCNPWSLRLETEISIKFATEGIALTGG